MMTFSRSVRVVVLCVAAALVVGLFSACGSSGGGSGSSASIDVSGQWVATVLNPDVATVNGCNGDLTSFNGMTISDITAAGPVCTTSDDWIVDQVGDTISSRRQDFSCDNGVTYSVTGQGSVSEQAVQITLTGVFSNGITSLDPLVGIETAPGRLEFEESRFSLSGAITGSCFISPPLRQTVDIF